MFQVSYFTRRGGHMMLCNLDGVEVLEFLNKTKQYVDVLTMENEPVDAGVCWDAELKTWIWWASLPELGVTYDE